jgi:hypothetical protein
MDALTKEKTMQRALNIPLRLERRAKSRVSVPFRAAVQGTDGDGVHFEVTTVLDNLSPGGLYLRLTQDVRVGSRLFVNVYMDRCDDAQGEQGFSLEVYGLVRRVDPLPGGACGVAVSFANSVLL